MLGELDKQSVEKILTRNILGRIACHDMGETYVVPISYAYDGDSLIIHSSAGKKVDMMRSNPRVCVLVDEIENMGKWKSVVVWGRYEELQGQEAADAVKILMKKFAGQIMSMTSRPEIIDINNSNYREFKSIIAKIRIGKKTGRYEDRI